MKQSVDEQTKSNKLASSSSSSIRESSDRDTWAKTLRLFSEMMKSEKEKFQKLLEDRDSQNQSLSMQVEHLTTSLSLAQTRIQEMNDLDAKFTRYNNAKFNFMISTKDNENSLYKYYSELNEKDLEDYNLFIQSQNSQIIDLKAKLQASQTIEKELKIELKLQRQAYKAQIEEKDAQISENKFIWNQLNIKDSKFNAVLKSKNLELEEANKKVKNLEKNLEQLEASSSRKDEIILKLKADLALASKTLQQAGTSIKSHTKGNIKEITASETVPRNLRSGSSKRSLEISNIVIRPCSGQSKRKALDLNIETPRLFSKNMKIPKIKSRD